MVEDRGETIECLFARKRHDGTAICIHDGRTKLNLARQPEPIEYWIPVRFIIDSDYTNINDLHIGERISIVIPYWLALDKGLI